MAKLVTHKDNLPFWGDKELAKISETKNFPDMVFELLSEREPSPSESKIFNLILNLSIDHGPETPSAKATTENVEDGESINKAVAKGIEEINDKHGGAGEKAMEMFYEIKKSSQLSADFVKKALAKSEKIYGYGHRIYKKDPRAEAILELLQKENLAEDYISIACEIESQLLAQKGINLPINIDGAMAVAFCIFGWTPKLAKAVFIISRTAGLCGHYLNNSKSKIDS